MARLPRWPVTGRRATEWALAGGLLHLHLRARPELVAIPGPAVPAQLPAWAGQALERLFRRVVIAASATERSEWRGRMEHALDEIDKLVVNCKDNRAHFRWGAGSWDLDETAGGVTGSAEYDALLGLRAKYGPLLQQTRDPSTLAKLRATLVPMWLAGQ
jgi:hypothetical protein